MKRLENIREIRRKIHREGTEEERELYKLGKNILKLLNKLSPGKKYKERWSSFNVLKNAFENNMQRYEGNYTSYFGNMFQEIKEQERQALGYHIHSD